MKPCQRFIILVVYHSHRYVNKETSTKQNTSQRLFQIMHKCPMQNVIYFELVQSLVISQLRSKATRENSRHIHNFIKVNMVEAGIITFHMNECDTLILMDILGVMVQYHNCDSVLFSPNPLVFSTDSRSVMTWHLSLLSSPTITIITYLL